MNSEYHIDVTPEEDQLFRDCPLPRQNRFKSTLTSKSLWIIVAGVHLLIVAAIVGVPTMSASNPKASDETISPAITQPQSATSNQPAPIALVTSNSTTGYASSQTLANRSLTTTYTVRPKDTIYSIAKKYKLSASRLIKLNNLKDPNKIVPGQVLKFL